MESISKKYDLLRLVVLSVDLTTSVSALPGLYRLVGTTQASPTALWLRKARGLFLSDCCVTLIILSVRSHQTDMRILVNWI